MRISFIQVIKPHMKKRTVTRIKGRSSDFFLIKMGSRIRFYN